MPAFYSNTLKNFLDDSDDAILGILASSLSEAGYSYLVKQQIESWKEGLNILRTTFEQIRKKSIDCNSWGIMLEYPIPRRAKRVDVVIIMDDKVVILEFKIGSDQYRLLDIEQLQNYCFDLRDFQSETRDRVIYPILLSSETVNSKLKITNVSNQGFIKSPSLVNSSELRDCLIKISSIDPRGPHINFLQWNKGTFAPTLNIIQAAQSLYSGHNVNQILRNEAGADQISKTTNVLIKATENARVSGKKIICFVTGVPGAGKTLVGLNLIHNKELFRAEESIGSFLTGNTPLVLVLREAIARSSSNHNKISLKEARRRVQSFIRNVHEFLGEYHKNNNIPRDNVIVFDEAQRAWNAAQSKKKFNRNFSEAEMMLSIMDRHNDWAVLIALIGGGQEINTGEAGLREWGDAVEKNFKHWEIHVSPELLEGDSSTAGQTLFVTKPPGLNIKTIGDLHLRVSVRALRASSLSRWVENILSGNIEKSIEILKNDLKRYPIKLTRSLKLTKEWLRSRLEENPKDCRIGLIASSGAKRLRAFGLDVSTRLGVAYWFLRGMDDIRSSNFLELPATEFAIQGLEIDYAGLCWGEDFRRNSDRWGYYSFSGTKWRNAKQDAKRQYIFNKYRVLLTRAREGLIIWIPKGSNKDSTRKVEYYEGTAEYLKKCGVEEI